MEIPKAIEILELNVKEAGSKMPTDTLAAVKLGIEALKRLKFLRSLSHNEGTKYIPGETKGD